MRVRGCNSEGRVVTQHARSPGANHSASNPCTEEVESSQEHPKFKVILRESKFEASLSYVNPCAKRREPEEAIFSRKAQIHLESPPLSGATPAGAAVGLRSASLSPRVLVPGSRPGPTPGPSSQAFIHGCAPHGCASLPLSYRYLLDEPSVPNQAGGRG